MNRRRFLIGSAMLAGTGIILPVSAARLERVKPEHITENPFSLGVASGDPSADGISLWTQLAPDPMNRHSMPGKPAEVIWEVSSRHDFTTDCQNGTETAWPELAHTVKPRIRGLKAGTEYFYRFRFGHHESRTGRFRTAPDKNDKRPVRFAVVSCNRYEDGWFHAFRHVLQDDVDFVFHAGDYIYEKASRADRMRPHGEPECFSLDDYRRRYALYRLDPDLQDLHANTAFISTWDDHEVAGNWAGETDKWDTPDRVFAWRRSAAIQAYWEAMPFNIPQPLPGGELHLYRSFQYGANIDFLVLDTRQYRSDQACGDTTTLLCDGARDASRTMLGSRQADWLRQTLNEGKATWPIIGQQVPSFLMDYDPEESLTVSMDKWDGYPAAQREYENILNDSGRVCMTVAGDAHQHIAAQRRQAATGQNVGADLVTTSVTSGGNGQERDSAWEVLQASNANLQYNSRRRGYLLINAQENQLDIEFRTLSNITEKQHQLFCAAKGTLNHDGELSISEINQLIREVE